MSEVTFIRFTEADQSLEVLEVFTFQGPAEGDIPEGEEIRLEVRPLLIRA
jgi:hypothetical protein